MSDVNNATESIMRKIQKLFALAGNNPNQAEAEAAMLKAQMLLMENGLSEEHVNNYTENNANSNDSVETRTPSKKQKSLKQWQLMIARVITPNFRCKFAVRTWNRVSDLVVYGMSQDVEMCKTVLEFSFVAFESLWKKYHTELIDCGKAGYSRRTTTALKNDYTRGFCEGLSARFAEQVQSKELMIVVPNAVISEFKRHTSGKYHSSSFSSLGDTQARGRGYSDGKMAQRDRYLA